ncbi:hypothetical protein C7J88_06125 [Staphylococcus muscae]|uniref:LPXTG-motif cell wall anchor domain-containing protein n=1 Tax=Staphylococcus muscae TaxID=1294 RepID=A0A240C8D7_9STAP|nr:LPXTG cell wall anchor domain-containing protein [Staphylococcus muscae]AVQ33767.1 hypothetical protein C7J88_06125 [Staphylococcus muscae]PNZ06275.1 hypothetical protein CD131_00650 [Staphylococcus muscae]GGA87568.1 hypothetical protein GCM10007183_09690 [Staphylococcus muscae]SNW04215.1 Uncharacterised protein [Staphylococcus muscae]
MLKKFISTSLITFSLLSIGNFTHAATNNDSDDDTLTANDSTEPPTPTDYDFPQDKAIPIGEQPPFIIVPDEDTNTPTDHDTKVHSSKTLTPSNQSNTSTSQTPQPPHTQLIVLPNTGGVSSTSPFAVYSLLLLGGAFVVYHPLTSMLMKSKL